MKDVLWTRDFLSEIGYRQTGSTRIYEDNNGCLGQATGTKGLRRARHYLVALVALNEACQAGDIHLHRIDSDENVADFFTKGLGGAKHTKFATQSLGVDMSYLYRSRRQIENSNDDVVNSHHGSEKEGERHAPLTCEKEGEHNVLLLSNNGLEKEGELNAPIYSKELSNDGLEKEGELNAPMYSKEYYLMTATKYAHEGNQPKFQMFMKLLNYTGHVHK